MWAGVFPLAGVRGDQNRFCGLPRQVSSYREAEEALQRLAGQSVPRSTIHRLVERYGEALAEWRQEKAE